VLLLVVGARRVRRAVCCVDMEIALTTRLFGASPGYQAWAATAEIVPARLLRVSAWGCFPELWRGSRPSHIDIRPRGGGAGIHRRVFGRCRPFLT
jgi:hypothetical protein